MDVKEIKKQLSKLKSLDEKKDFLKQRLKRTSDKIIKKYLEKLLEDINKQIEDESKPRIISEKPAEGIEKKLDEDSIEKIKKETEEFKIPTTPSKRLLENLEYIPSDKSKSAKVDISRTKYETQMIEYGTKEETIKSLQHYFRDISHDVQKFNAESFYSLKGTDLIGTIYDKVKDATGLDGRDLSDTVRGMFGIADTYIKQESEKDKYDTKGFKIT